MFSGKTRSVAIHSIQIQSSADGFPLGSSPTTRSFLTFNHPDIIALKHDYFADGHGLFEERRVS
jgi:hypothetical protein